MSKMKITKWEFIEMCVYALIIGGIGAGLLLGWFS